jgi:glutamine amidotransferase
MVIAVLDYGIGNLRSAEKALQHLGADAALVATPEAAAGAAGVVLPGVGSFGRCMEALRRSGLDRVVDETVASGRPFIGICVGMQMLYDGSDESPGVPGLGVLPGRVRRLPDGVKRPQMQWNRLVLEQPAHPMVQGLGPDPWVYFVHSYAPPAGDGVVATCEYGGKVVAAVARDQVWATQFHPEKSGPVGLALLDNFVAAVAGSAARDALTGRSATDPASARSGPGAA